MGKTVAILGATGQMGGHLMKEVLGKGHSVKALARSIPKLADKFPEEVKAGKLTVLQGDATNAGDIKKCVEGTDVTISTLGTVDAKNPIMEKAAKGILAADPKRLLFVSTLGTNGSSPLTRFLLHRVINFPGNGVIPDVEEAENRIFESKKKNWVVVRPNYLEDHERTGSWEAYYEPLAPRFMSPMAKADVACFLAAYIEDATWDGCAVHLHKGEKKEYDGPKK